MRLSIIHPLILPIMLNLPHIIRRMNQISILHQLRKQETLLEIIIPASTRRINILETRKSTSDTSRGVDGYEAVPGPISVFLVASGAVGVVK